MQNQKLAGIALALALVLWFPSAHAQVAGEETWTALADDASRMELFEKFVVPAREKADEASGERPVDLSIPSNSSSQAMRAPM